MRRTALLLGLALIIGVGVAHAHYYQLHYTHFLKFSAPGVATAKEVASATVRYGVLAMPPLHQPGMPWGMPFKPFWAGEKSMALERKGDHFFAKARIDVSECDGGPQMGPVMVEYTLKFKDGSDLILREQSVKIETQANTSDYESYNRAMAEAGKAFNAAADAKETSCSSVSFYTRNPGY